MVCHPFRAVRVRADKAYTRLMIGVRRSYQERQRERVRCTECGKDLVRESLDEYCQNQHGIEKLVLIQEGYRVYGEDKPKTYRMEFTENAGARHCPVEGCSGQFATWTSMRVHFWHRQVWDTVLILEEGNLPQPR